MASQTAAPRTRPPSECTVPLARQLRAWRQEAGFNCSEAADAAGVYTETVYRSENPEPDIRVSSLRKLLDAYGVDVVLPTGSDVRQWRILAGLSISDVDRASPVSASTVCRFERSEHDVFVSSLRGLVTFFERELEGER